ncbi:MAG: hypothetical protein ACT4QD_15320 [Acidobacteriota bacterium]
MRLLISTAIALSAASVVTGPAIHGATPPNRPKDIKVAVTFRDDGGDKIQSDGRGPYADGVGGVVAYIATRDHGKLIFGTGTAGRMLQFFFDDCLLPPADCGAPWSSLNERSGIHANALRNSPDGLVVPQGGLMAMAVNEELAAWTKIDIPKDDDPAFYNVCFDSRKLGPCGLAPGGTSTDARIRRVASDEWTIWANGTGDRADVIRDSTTKGNRTFTLLGTYSMPFSLTVKCVNRADCP